MSALTLGGGRRSTIASTTLPGNPFTAASSSFDALFTDTAASAPSQTVPMATLAQGDDGSLVGNGQSISVLVDDTQPLPGLLLHLDSLDSYNAGHA